MENGLCTGENKIGWERTIGTQKDEKIAKDIPNPNVMFQWVSSHFPDLVKTVSI